MGAMIVIPGYVAGEVEIEQTQSGTDMVRFTVPVSEKRQGKETTNWYKVRVFGARAKGLATLAQQGKMAKGAYVVVSGSLMLNTFTGRDGKERNSLDVSANDVQFVAPPKNYVEGYGIEDQEYQNMQAGYGEDYDGGYGSYGNAKF